MHTQIQPIYDVSLTLVLGATPVPKGSRVLGVVCHPRDGMWGALVLLHSGVYVHIAAGCTRSLPQREAAEAARKFAS